MENELPGQVFALDLIEGISNPALSFGDREEPLCIHILKSGWGHPQLYHVLVEFGDEMQTTYHTLEASQITDMFGIDVEKSFTNRPIVIRKDTIAKTPNDGYLGKTIRSMFND